jgi:glutaredoxin-related protein
MFAFSSEMCGLDKAIPERVRSSELQPMKYDVAFVDAARAEVKKWNQWETCTPLH